MNKNLILSSMIGVFLSINNSYAAFEYNGTFASNRASNEVQSYYILLSENTNVTFSFKSNGKESKEVFVTSIKLTSDESINLKSNSGIYSYKVTTTGIYEVSVSSNAALNKEITYDLLVNESANKSEVTTNNDTASVTETATKTETPQKIVEPPKEEIQVPVAQNFTSIGAAKIVDSEEVSSQISPTSEKKEEQKPETKTTISSEINNQNTVSEPVSNNNPIEETTPKSDDIAKHIASNTIPVKEVEKPIQKEDVVEKTIAAPLSKEDDGEATGFDFAQLDPDAPAVEDDETEVVTSKPVIKPKTLTYSGKIGLIESIEAYRFLGDKNKCWPTKICFDADNNYWVLDSQLCHITCYSPKGTEWINFGTKGKAVNELGIPVSLAVFKNYVLVGDRQKNSIHVFDKKGNWKNLIQSDPNVGLKISNPASICIRNNEIWIGDSSSKRILCFDEKLSFLGSFGSSKESKIAFFFINFLSLSSLFFNFFLFLLLFL